MALDALKKELDAMDNRIDFLLPLPNESELAKLIDKAARALANERAFYHGA